MQLRSPLNWLPLAVAAAAALAATPSHAVLSHGPVVCSDSINTIANDAYANDCQGPMLGTIGSGGAMTATFGGLTYVFVGATGDASGAFSGNPTPALWGGLTLAATQNQSFVIGLQGSASYSLYLFNGGAGSAALDFDAFGLVNAGGTVDNAVTRAGLFALGQVAAVPEPASVALMLAGVGGVALSVRRRRQQRGAASSR